MKYDQKNAEVGSRTEGLVHNNDGSVDLYFGPKAPEGIEANWIQTEAGNSWFPLYRLYTPTKKISGTNLCSPGHWKERIVLDAD